MLPLRIIPFLILFNIILFATSGPLQLWTYELIEFYTNSSNRNIMDLDFKIVRLGRGQHGFSGFVDVKTGFYDDVFIGATVMRSLNRDGPYARLPMVIDNYTLVNAMNMFYKTLVQPSAVKCCEDAPIVKGKFRAPLTKRKVIINKCTLSTDNLPNIIMEGYYKFSLSFYGPFEVYGEVKTYVESKTL